MEDQNMKGETQRETMLGHSYSSGMTWVCEIRGCGSIRRLRASTTLTVQGEGV